MGPTWGLDGPSSRRIFMGMSPSRVSPGQSEAWEALESLDSKPMPKIRSYGLASARILSPVPESSWRKRVVKKLARFDAMFFPELLVELCTERPRCFCRAGSEEAMTFWRDAKLPKNVAFSGTIYCSAQL